MNALTVISDAELDQAIEVLKERELAIQTDNGKKYVVSKMRELIMYLEKLGYKPDADERALSTLWARSLSEEFIRLGEDGLREAVTEWVEGDANNYRVFPKIPWIKDACARVGGDPRVEKGRRMQAEVERKMEGEHRKEVEEFKAKHPALWEMVQKKAAEMQAQQERSTSDMFVTGGTR